MFRVAWNKRYWTHPIITTDWQWLIRGAWGPRRVSSRSAPGTLAYPRKLTASLGLWVHWIRTERKVTGIVYSPTIAQKRIDDQIKDITPEPEPRPTLDPSEISEIEKKRKEYRSLGDYETADALRDYLVKHGVVVGDSSTG